MTVRVISERAKRDKERYHPANPADYGSSIGMPYELHGRTYYACVGCWYCAGEIGKDFSLDVDASERFEGGPDA